MVTRYLKIREPKLNDISRVSDARRVDHSRELWSIVFGEESVLYESPLFRKRKLNKAHVLRFLLPHYMNNLFALQFRKDGFDGPWIPNPGFRTKPNSVIPAKSDF